MSSKSGQNHQQFMERSGSSTSLRSGPSISIKRNCKVCLRYFISISLSSDKIDANSAHVFIFFFFLKNAFCFYFYFCKSFASLLCSYFLDNAERICNTNYIPTVKDILHARLKTTGASELKFEVKQHKFLVIDVGGQRCQRTQWYIMAKPK